MEGSAALLGAIRKEQFFTEKYARAAEKRFAETGKSDFQLNPKALKPVTAGVGVVDKSRKSAEDEEKKEAKPRFPKAYKNMPEMLYSYRSPFSTYQAAPHVRPA